MSSYVGIPNNNPTKYLGPTTLIESIVTRNRAPTGADIRQGSTGKYYPIGSLWLVGENPTTGSQGDLWWLSKIVANVAYWTQVTASLLATEEFAVQAGTTPVIPLANVVTVSGAFVSAMVSGGNNPIRTNGTTANTITIQVQPAQQIAGTDATKVGFAAFSSAAFTVDANGFVGLLGGSGAALLTLDGDSGSATPTSGAIKISGGSTGLLTTGAGSTITLSGTLAIANGGTDATSFTQTNGIVTFNGTRLVNYAGPQLSTAGVYTNTTQPAFFAFLSTPATNTTGNGTNYFLGNNSGGAVTVQSDQGSNITFVGGVLTFTVPVTGYYAFHMQFGVTGITTAMTGYNGLFHVNGGLNIASVGNPADAAAPAASNGFMTLPQSLAQKLNAGDTVTFGVVLNGGIGDTCGISNSGNTTYASGYLLC